MIVCIAKVVRSPLKKVVTAVLWIGFILAMTSASAAEDSQDRKSLRNLIDIKHIIVIYEENWSFDSFYGQFPGANGCTRSCDTLAQLAIKRGSIVGVLNHDAAVRKQDCVEVEALETSQSRCRDLATVPGDADESH